MPVVSSVDYTAKLVYLSADTVDVDLDTLDVYRELRARRRLTEADRSFRPMVVAGGNVEKRVGLTYTAPYVQLLYGCRLVPWDVSHRIRLIRDTFTDDGLAGRDVFDRSPLSSGTDVDIDVQVDAVEVRVVEGVGGVAADVAALRALAEGIHLHDEPNGVRRVTDKDTAAVLLDRIITVVVDGNGKQTITESEAP